MSSFTVVQPKTGIRPAKSQEVANHHYVLSMLLKIKDDASLKKASSLSFLAQSYFLWSAIFLHAQGYRCQVSQERTIANLINLKNLRNTSNRNDKGTPIISIRLDPNL